MKRGFAAMDPAKQREIASKGGRAAQDKGVAHRYQPGSDLAREAGRKGGLASRGGRGKAPAVSVDAERPSLDAVIEEWGN
jgi:general stress protein YciG